MGEVDLEVPEDERTIETGKACYQYHIDNSEYDGGKSVEDLRDYRYFEEDMEEIGTFRVYEEVTHAIADSAEPSLQQVQYDYRDDDSVVSDPEGLSKFVEGLEAARENLASEGELGDARDRKIEKCINIVRFARENGYGVYFG